MGKRKYRKVKTDMTAPPDDDSEWDNFIEDAEGLVGMLDDLPERAEEFAGDVRERLESMIEWARDNKHATPKMWQTLYNTRDAVGRWLL